MRKITYAPEGAEPVSWEFAPDKLLNVEAMEIEKRTGMTFVQWGQELGRGSMTALTALLYVLMRRSRPSLKFEEVQFSMTEVTIETDKDEAGQVLAHLEKKAAAGELTDVESAALDNLRAQGVEAVDPS